MLIGVGVSCRISYSVAYNSFIMYIIVILSKYLKPNRWPKSGPLALNGVLMVAQKWPVGKQKVSPGIQKWFRGSLNNIT